MPPSGLHTTKHKRDVAIETSFILEKNYNESNFLEKNTKIKIKYYPLENNKNSYLKKGQKISINILSNNIECEIIKHSKNKYKCIIEITKPIYNINNLTFIITQNNRLFGYGKDVNCENEIIKEKTLYKNSLNYDEMYEMFIERFNILNAPKQKTQLPIPKITYLNTFSTVLNFSDYCSLIKTEPNKLGLFIFTEQGFKSWSINSKKQLIVKGRLSEQKLMSNIIKFCYHKVCSKCKSVNTFNFTDRNVKKILCKDCNWSEPLKVL